MSARSLIFGMTARLTFHGGVGMVTGSNFLLEVEGLRILIDCGFFQGCDVCDDKNRAPFPYDPASIHILLITHAHLDHTGRIPYLVKKGFKGKIISTSPSKDISEMLFLDSVEIARNEKNGERPLLYEEGDIQKTMALWKGVPYDEALELGHNVRATFKDAGHILGSAMIQIEHEKSSGGRGKKILFTGDLGNSPDPLLPDTETVRGIDYLVMESVYGDRVHEDREVRSDKLEDVIEHVVKMQGVLLIPAFSIERTQEILFEIRKMMEESEIPLIPVFLDSPLSIKAMALYEKYSDYFKKEVQDEKKAGRTLLGFPQLTLVGSAEQSKMIDRFANPKVIIAGSGMSDAGRIIFHEKKYLGDPRTTLLFVGYQVPGSLGRKILDGAREVTIGKETIAIKAGIQSISGYSGHKDRDHLVEFVEESADWLKKVFVVMGEPASSAFLTQRLRDYLGVNAVVPQEGESIELDF